MIGAGVNAKALAQYMGHSSIKLTFDLYGHLMPGSEREAARCSTRTWSGRARRSIASRNHGMTPVPLTRSPLPSPLFGAMKTCGSIGVTGASTGA